MHRVAITGFGIVSCLGCDIAAVASALREGRSGVAVDEKRREMGFLSPLTGVIRDFDPAAVLPKKARKTMPDFAVQAYKAATDALSLARIDPESLRGDPDTGLLFGCDSSCLTAVEQVDLLRERRDTATLGSGHVFRSMTSTVTMNLNTLFGTRGASWTLSGACASGGHAVGQAADLIALGRQRRMICGGAQELNWESMCSFDGLGAFSRRVDSPAEASRPFDAGRDGLVPSGGAAALVLERYDDARARGAGVLGEVIGYGFSSDGGHISQPSDTGLAAAMRMALGHAGLRPSDIGYVSAHATSTPAGDRAEARNIRAVFGPRTPPVSALKAMTGHELWMAGASQVVYCAIMAREGFTARSVNFTSPDEESAHLSILTETLPLPPETVLCNAAGFGGTNSCLIVRFGG